jgi:hypothetical protein
MKPLVWLFAAGWLLVSAEATLAQAPVAPTQDPAQADVEDQDLISPQTSKRVEELRAELRALLEQSRENAEDMVREFQGSAGLTDRQVYGIAAGIVVGAFVADLMGGGGLTTIALATGGGALGNWVMGGN